MKEETKNKVRKVSKVSGIVIGSCASSLIGWGLVGLGRGFMKPTALNKVVSTIGGFGVGLACQKVFGDAVEESINEVTESVIELVDMMQPVKVESDVEDEPVEETQDA